MAATRQPQAPQTPHAAIYVRVSTRAQEDEGTSLQSQEEACRTYVTTHGYTLDEAHVYREVFTGTELWDRPRLTAMRAAVRGGHVCAVIVYATDRLARDPIHLAIIAEECERWGVTLAFVTEPLDASPEGALIRYVKGYAAKIEHEKIRERTLRGKRHIAEMGQLHNHGFDLFGYRRDKEARKRTIHEPEAVTVRQIFRWVGDEHMPIRSVAKRLNETGVPSPGAGKLDFGDAERQTRWGTTMVRRILHNSTYAGEAYAWRYQTNKQHKDVNRPEADWIKLPDGTAPAIVTPELFGAAARQLADGGGATTRNATRPYLLRGLICCAVCGRRMFSTPERNTRVYRCSSRDTAAGKCGGKRVPAEAIEAWAWGQVAAALKDPTLIAAEVQRQRDEGPDPTLTNDLETARKALGALAKQEERLGRRLRDADDALWALVERELRDIEREKRQLQATIDEIAARLTAQGAAVDQLDALADYCATVAGNLDSFDFEDKRLALEALEVCVRANGGTRTPDWSVSGCVPVGNAGVLSQSC